MKENKDEQSGRLNQGAAAGPLIVSEANPRYFTIASEADSQKAIYLTGSHIWNNFQDGMGPGSKCADAPEQFDYKAYLKFLKEHGHNFIRLWRWEHFKSQAAEGNFHLCMAPQPWLRTGSGIAKDGKPKFDLDSLDQNYFDRLRDRIIAAGNEGIYVSVMLFDGWALHLSPAPENIEGHPFYGENNINGITIKSITDYQVLPLDPQVQDIQKAYIRKVVDTVHDLPNVLWEVANESSGGGSVDKNFAEMLGLRELPEWGDSTAWQYWVIDTVKEHEQEMGYDKHPIGMTMPFPVADQTKVNDRLFNSAANWISPGFEDEIFTSRWFSNPPSSDGRKVVISDTDHYAPGKGEALWAWKSFLRGCHPILMDFGLIAGVNPSSPSAEMSPEVPSYEAFEAARYAMGDTLRYAQKMDLIKMEPRDDLSSTGYVLANPGKEYLILEPSNPTNSFKVKLELGAYAVEWFSVNSRETKDGGEVAVGSDMINSFTSPFEKSGPVILYLKQKES